MIKNRKELKKIFFTFNYIFSIIKYIVFSFFLQNSISQTFAAAVFSPATSYIELPNSISVPPTAKVGDIIYTASIPVSSQMRDGISSTSIFSSEYTPTPSLSSYGKGIYNTGIEGIGFKLIGNFSTPGKKNITQIWGNPPYSNFYWEGSQTDSHQEQATLQFIITGPFKSGAIDLSQYKATLAFNIRTSADTSKWTINFQGKTNIIVATCEVTTPNIDLFLGTYNTKDFTGKGSTLPEKEMSIGLNCPIASVAPLIIFSGNDSQETGFYNNSGSSKGIGVQLLYKDSLVIPNEAVSLSDSAFSGIRYFDFKARLYQSENEVEPGTFDSIINFKLTYE